VATAIYPVDIQLDAPLEVARWRVIGNPILAIPHVIIAEALLLVAYILSVIGWFAILFTGKLPDFIFDFTAMSFRYFWRATSYQYWMREPYPPFDFETTADEDGLDPPTRYVVQAPDGPRNRLTVFFRGLLVIPHYIALMFVGIAAYVVIIIGFFAVLFTGAWPQGLRDFMVGVQRWGVRVGAYLFLMTDEYPPFSLT
jgi:small-conductance mechanosensitive channel